MSKYDVKVYIPKAIYEKLSKLATFCNISVSKLLGEIIRDESFNLVLDPLTKHLDEIIWAFNEFQELEKRKECQQEVDNGTLQ